MVFLLRDFRNKYGGTPLKKALKHGAAMVKLMVEAGANINAVDKDGNTLLADKIEKKKQVEALVGAGVDVNIASGKKQELPLFLASGNKEILEILRGAERLDFLAKNKFGETAFHQACASGDQDKVNNLLEIGVPIDILGLNGRTPICYAIKDEDILKDFIEKGADVTKGDDKGVTPVHFAASEGNKDSLKILMKAGAKLNARDKKGRTPLMAVSGGWGSDSVIELLLKKGCKMSDTDNNGATMLHYTTDVKILHKCLDQDIDVNAQDHKGRTALHGFCMGIGKISLAMALLDASGIYFSPFYCFSNVFLR